MSSTNKSNKVKKILFLQGIVMIYTLSGVMAKLASHHPTFSFSFFFYYGIEIFILGVYALLWQQVIKRIDLSIAYANRSLAIVWSMIWASLFFKESISIKNILGVVIVVAGTMIVNKDYE